jgi:RimJ/RimL family protein N-acetyltransferase
MASGLVQRWLRTGREEETPAQCKRGRHVFQTPGLLLQTPTLWDRRIMQAGASDPQAQRWLGWPEQDVTPERDREHLLALPAGRGRALSGTGGSLWWLAAVDPADNRVAGLIVVDWDTGEIGCSLAPRFRGRGLGTGLFASAAEFAHYHLGIPSITAGTEPGNAACVGALASAEFIRVAGPDTHYLPDGRVVPARWFRHESAEPTTCGA